MKLDLFLDLEQVAQLMLQFTFILTRVTCRECVDVLVSTGSENLNTGLLCSNVS